MEERDRIEQEWLETAARLQVRSETHPPWPGNCDLIKVALFIPCYVDQFYPHVGMATVSVLEHFGVEVVFPTDQTCCGLPMANSGCMEEAKPLAEKFVDVFDGFDYIVAPSGNCVSMVRNHYDHLCDHHDERAATVRKRTMD